MMARATGTTKHALITVVGAVAAWMLVAPAGAGAQVAWDVPAMMRPGAPSGLSLLLIEAHPGDGLGGLAIWRGSPAPVGLGFRGGIAEEPGDDAAVILGIDVSGPLASPGTDGQPQVIWWTGAGAGVGEELLLSFPLGLVLGWELSDEGVTFAPHVGAHVTLDVITGPGDDLDLDGSVDLGVDLGFASGLMVRFAAAVGGRESLGIGVRLPR
jgi:hypothetical protein